MKRIDLTNQKFGRLTAISFAGKNKYNRAMWLCRCSCGKEKVISSNSLRRGLTRSCGCLDQEAHIKKPNRTTHGESKTRLYRIWKRMKSRCYNPNTEDYKKWYGGQGVKMCDEWKCNYISFRNWSLQHGYNDNLTIDRINPFGNYEPSNCRWVTPAVQANNKRKGGDHLA